MIKRLVLTAAAVLLAACAGDPAGSTQGGLRAEPEGTAVVVTNTTDQPVYYIIVNPEALASWMPCTSPADCPEIGGRQTVRIPHAAIEMHQPDGERAELYWWKFARIEGGYVTVDEGRLRIRL